MISYNGKYTSDISFTKSVKNRHAAKFGAPDRCMQEYGKLLKNQEYPKKTYVYGITTANAMNTNKNMRYFKSNGMTVGYVEYDSTAIEIDCVPITHFNANNLTEFDPKILFQAMFGATSCVVTLGQMKFRKWEGC